MLCELICQMSESISNLSWWICWFQFRLEFNTKSSLYKNVLTWHHKWDLELIIILIKQNLQKHQKLKRGTVKWSSSRRPPIRDGYRCPIFVKTSPLRYIVVQLAPECTLMVKTRAKLDLNWLSCSHGCSGGHFYTVTSEAGLLTYLATSTRMYPNGED